MDFSLLKYVPASESDREFCFQVKKTAQGLYVRQIWGWDEDHQRAFHTKDWNCQKPDVIMYDKKPIGTIVLTRTTGHIEISQFFISPEHQRKGIDTYLLEHVLDEADASGKIVKLAYLSNSPVKSLYDRHGFRILERNETHCFAERVPQKHRA